jgi:O-antigen/teichoic acid export membrane protein
LSIFARNISANLIGRACIALLGIVVVPIVLRLLGIEAYGLVSFFTSLQAIFSVLDLGLSSTINRELARLTARRHAPSEPRDLMRTLELCYWLTALLIGTVVLAFSSLVPHWVHSVRLSSREIHQAAVIMAAVIALQWPLSLYEGALMGLQRQVAWTVISVSATAVRQVGAVLLLLLVSPTLHMFLLWQAVASGLQTGATAVAVWHYLPADNRSPAFRVSVFRSVWRFAAGMSATLVVTLGMTQLDRVVLSRFLTLDQFGYYSLAAVVAGSLHYVSGPVFAAAFPRFSELVAVGDESRLSEEYHRVSQLASVLLLSCAVTLIAFAPEVIYVWTGSVATAARTRLVVVLLVSGTALNCLSHVPYALQLSYGWTRLSLSVNTVALVLLAPLSVWTASRFGGVGVAALWLGHFAVFLLITTVRMHHRLLHQQLGRWYLQDVLLPFCGCAASIVLWRLIAPTGGSRVVLAGTLGLAATTTVTAAALLSSQMRTVLRAIFARLMPHPVASLRG